MSEILHELEKYGVKGIVTGDHIIISKRRPTFEFEMTVKDIGHKDDLLVTSMSVKIKQKDTEFRYSLYNGNEKVYLRYQRGEITGHARGIVSDVYLPLYDKKEVLTSSRALYGFVRFWSSFEYLLPEDYFGP
jgi:hypothetical protein